MDLGMNRHLRLDCSFFYLLVVAFVVDVEVPGHFASHIRPPQLGKLFEPVAVILNLLPVSVGQEAGVTQPCYARRVSVRSRWVTSSPRPSAGAWGCRSRGCSWRWRRVPWSRRFVWLPRSLSVAAFRHRLSVLRAAHARDEAQRRDRALEIGTGIAGCHTVGWNSTRPARPGERRRRCGRPAGSDRPACGRQAVTEHRRVCTSITVARYG